MMSTVPESTLSKVRRRLRNRRPWRCEPLVVSGGAGTYHNCQVSRRQPVTEGRCTPAWLWYILCGASPRSNLVTEAA
jgi:hypothetical protein